MGESVVWWSWMDVPFRKRPGCAGMGWVIQRSPNRGRLREGPPASGAAFAGGAQTSTNPSESSWNSESKEPSIGNEKVDRIP